MAPEGPRYYRLPYWRVLVEKSMLMNSFVAAPLLAVLSFWPSNSTLLSTRNFDVAAWYCEGKGCSSTPRRLYEPVSFDRKRWEQAMARLESLSEKWYVVLNCEANGSRLTKCRLEDDTLASDRGKAIAAKMVRDLRIERLNGNTTVGKRVLVSIDYAPGFCPKCPATPYPAASDRSTARKKVRPA